MMTIKENQAINLNWRPGRNGGRVVRKVGRENMKRETDVILFQFFI